MTNQPTFFSVQSIEMFNGREVLLHEDFAPYITHHPNATKPRPYHTIPHLQPAFQATHDRLLKVMDRPLGDHLSHVFLGAPPRKRYGFASIQEYLSAEPAAQEYEYEYHSSSIFGPHIFRQLVEELDPVNATVAISHLATLACWQCDELDGVDDLVFSRKPADYLVGQEAWDNYFADREPSAMEGWGVGPLIHTNDYLSTRGVVDVALTTDYQWLAMMDSKLMKHPHNKILNPHRLPMMLEGDTKTTIALYTTIGWIIYWTDHPHLTRDNI